MTTLHTPWSDEITLIRQEGVKDAEGFETITEIRSVPPLFCDFEDGVSQSEFYRSQKAGNQGVSKGPCQPPKKQIAPKADMTNMPTYSAMKNMA